MRVLKTILGLKTALETKRPEQSVGLVPTMGALHIGHASLIKQARGENALVIVSIFLNPLQFSPLEDLQHYPSQPAQDVQLCLELGVDLIFIPSVAELGITSQQLQTQVVPPHDLTSTLCGAFRENHFTGVATIVTKLLNIVSPDVVYFGEKDIQQLVIIKKVVKELNFPVTIKACPTVREVSGLACSSRNTYLSQEEHDLASNIYKALSATKTAFSQGEKNSRNLIHIAREYLTQAIPKIEIQYLELVEPETLQPLSQVEDVGLLAVAAYIGSTRLIDNIKLSSRLPIIAIDGPAGAGKSTVTRRLATELNLLYLDTGAMYRGVTWLLQEANISLDDHISIAELVATVQIELMPSDSPNYSTEVYINHQRVTEIIRASSVTSMVSQVAAISCVRTVLVQMQKDYGAKGGVIAEGRDIATCVFPEADLKIFLTASVGERVKRRQQDLQKQGNTDIDIEKLTQDIERRDYLDSTRAISPLKKAADAVEIVTDGMSLEEVKQAIVNLYRNLF